MALLRNSFHFLTCVKFNFSRKCVYIKLQHKYIECVVCMWNGVMLSCGEIASTSAEIKGIRMGVKKKYSANYYAIHHIFFLLNSGAWFSLWSWKNFIKLHISQSRGCSFLSICTSISPSISVKWSVNVCVDFNCPLFIIFSAQFSL